jgi:hypothetical protein
MKADPITLLAMHVLDTLPDSLSRQKELLQSVYTLIKPSHPARDAIAKALMNVHDLERNKERAQLKFAELSNTPAR